MFAGTFYALLILAVQSGQVSITPAPARPIRLFATGDPSVAITFDACATKTQGYEFDRAIFEIIKTERIPVTIFVSGRWVEAHPDAMAELAQEPLIEFGDHSYDHPHMPTLTDDLIAGEIDQTEAALAVYGKRSVAFRPPFGEWSSRMLTVAHYRQLPTVTWDVVSGDPNPNTTPERMIKSVVSKARSGSIIIFHINGRGYKTALALPQILQELRERGFRFARLSELLAGARGETVLAAAPQPPAESVSDASPVSVAAEAAAAHAPEGEVAPDAVLPLSPELLAEPTVPPEAPASPGAALSAP